MKITKDLLNALNIETIYIQKGYDLFLCFPLKMKQDYWMISTDTDNLEGQITLKIKFNSFFLKIKAEVDSFVEDSGLHAFIYTIKIKSEAEDDLQKMFFDTIHDMEKKYKEWNKRSEERYDIGGDEHKKDLLHLKQFEQVLIFENMQFPCLINNISFSGAKITTFESDFYKEKKLLLCLSFIKPIEQIQIVATIRNASIRILDNNQTISILSVKFDSTPIEFKYRLEKFIAGLEDEHS